MLIIGEALWVPSLESFNIWVLVISTEENKIYDLLFTINFDKLKDLGFGWRTGLSYIQKITPLDYLDLILSLVFHYHGKLRVNSQEFFMLVHSNVNKSKARIKMFYPFNFPYLANREITLFLKYFQTFCKISHDLKSKHIQKEFPKKIIKLQCIIYSISYGFHPFSILLWA